jgi:hypothetical protein
MLAVADVSIVSSNFARMPSPAHAGMFAAGLTYTMILYYAVILPGFATFSFDSLISFYANNIKFSFYRRLLQHPTEKELST